MNLGRHRALGQLIAAALLCLSTLTARATTLPPIGLWKLFRDADIVALVQVVSGETMGAGADSCGAKYGARVIEAFKGTAPGATIEFGNYYGYEIGGRYILFLVAPGHTYEPMMSTNSMELNGRAEYERRCGLKLFRNTVMHSGNGALRIHWVSAFEYKDGVAVPTRYVVLPDGLSTIPAKISEINQVSGEVWVRLPEMTKVLKGLRAASPDLQGSSEACTRLYTDQEALALVNAATAAVPQGQSVRKPIVLQQLGIDIQRLCNRRFEAINLGAEEAWQLSPGYDLTWWAAGPDAAPLNSDNAMIHHVRIVTR